jgi:hypothetical protein
VAFGPLGRVRAGWREALPVRRGRHRLHYVQRIGRDGSADHQGGRPTAGRKPVVGKKDYLAYFGRYELDVQNEVVRHLLEGELFPGHAEDLERKYHFFDEKLSLKPLDGTNREILWQRV